MKAFVHGEMVMSYSGRRLLSNYMSSKENVEYDDTKHYNLVEEKRPGTTVSKLWRWRWNCILCIKRFMYDRIYTWIN